MGADIVYSQPADTGTGTHVNTQLVYAVSHLKVNPTTETFLRLSNVNPLVNTQPYAVARHCNRHQYTPRHQLPPSRKIQSS
jgi:transcription initiation factor TFIIE subunit beta